MLTLKSDFRETQRRHLKLSVSLFYTDLGLPKPNDIILRSRAFPFCSVSLSLSLSTTCENHRERSLSFNLKICSIFESSSFNWLVIYLLYWLNTKLIQTELNRDSSPAGEGNSESLLNLARCLMCHQFSQFAVRSSFAFSCCIFVALNVIHVVCECVDSSSNNNNNNERNETWNRPASGR